MIRGDLYLESIRMASILGINPVRGGSPANEINRIDRDSCVVGCNIVVFLSCLEVIRFIEFRIINRGIISEQ